MKFKYGDNIEFTKGFYKGQKGIVKECRIYRKHFGLLTEVVYAILLADIKVDTLFGPIDKVVSAREDELRLVHVPSSSKDVISFKKK